MQKGKGPEFNPQRRLENIYKDNIFISGMAKANKKHSKNECKYEEKEACLEKLKEKYEKIREKYNLPEFSEMNKDFSIERISEVESDYLVREIRRVMAEKFSNYIRFIEALLNPVNSPMFVFSVVKSLTSEDKEKLKDIYKKLAKIEVEILEVDTDFKEEKEAEFINRNFKEWSEMKKELLKIITSINSNWNSKNEGNNKGYFG